MNYCIANISVLLNLSFHLESYWIFFEKVDLAEKKERDIFCSQLSFQLTNRDLSFAECENVTKVLKVEESFALCDESFHHAYLSVKNQEELSVLLAYLFYTHAIRRQMLKVHCSIVEDHGRGILFIGPSGIGKTTQAERWAQYRDATIINGDVGFVECKQNEYIAWGTPWHGSSPYCENMSVPVYAIVVLKQATENQLRLLTGFEKVTEVSSSILYPTWLEDGIELCTNLLHQLLNDLPVYRLDNRADEEAVQLLAEEIDRIADR